MDAIQNTAVLLFQILLYTIAASAIITAVILQILFIRAIARKLGVEIRLSFRPRKIDAWNEAKSILFLAGFGWLGFITAGFVLNGLLGLGLPLFYFSVAGISIGMLAGFWRHLTGGQPMFVSSNGKVKTHRRQFASVAPWHVGLGKDGIDKDKILRWYDKRDKPVNEFVFAGLDLPTVIPESVMYRFCRLALERHNISRDTEARTYKRTGRKIRAHEVLSEVYFTSELSPKFITPEYDAIYEILYLTGYWQNRRVGYAGDLMVAPGTTPQKLVHRARWGWIDIVIKFDKKKKPFWKL